MLAFKWILYPSEREKILKQWKNIIKKRTFLFEFLLLLEEKQKIFKEFLAIIFPCFAEQAVFHYWLRNVI